MYGMLVPVDRNESRALHQAKYVASLPEAAERVEATVLHVAPPEAGYDADEMELVSGSRPMNVSERIESVVAAADYLEERGITLNRAADTGAVPERIVRIAEREETREIVMGGRKHSGVAEVLLGSTVMDVFQSTDRPVTVTGTSMAVRGGSHRVLIPVGANRDRALHQAEYVAGLPGAVEDVSATVAHVFAARGYRGGSDHEFEDADAAVAAADRLEEASVDVERVALTGNVSRSILDAAEDHGADSIVLGGRNRSGIQSVLLGSTAQDVVRSADRPVTITG